MDPYADRSRLPPAVAVQPNSGYMMAANVMGALSNPYAQQQPSSSVSSHYSQAYQSAHYAAAYGPMNGHPAAYAATPGASNSAAPTYFKPPVNSSSWYSPGTSRCTYPQCSFMGSAQSLEIHRMDRHLIYPPGWKEKKKKRDWDADPSLIGYVHYFPRSLLYRRMNN
jgi:hypothetical protein